MLTGSVLHGTKVDLLTWLAVLNDVTTISSGTSALLLPTATSISDSHGVTVETARHMRARLAAALRELGYLPPLQG